MSTLKKSLLNSVQSAFQGRCNKLIIFDLDGTLIHSDRVMSEALDKCYQLQYPGESPDYEYFFSMMGDSLSNIFSRMNIPAHLLSVYREYSRQNIHKITLVSNLLSGIFAAKMNGKNIAIYTGKEKDRTLELLDYFNISNLFDYILTSEDVQNTKPHPEGIYKILNYFGISHEHALMIGDSLNDIKAANDANVRSIFVSWKIDNANISPDNHIFPTLLGVTNSPRELQGVLKWL